MSTPCPHCGQRYWPASSHDSAWCLQTQMTKAPAAPAAAASIDELAAYVDGALVEATGRTRTVLEDISHMIQALPRTAVSASGKCCCGEPTTLGVVHRLDGPCFHYESSLSTTQERK